MLGSGGRWRSILAAGDRYGAGGADPAERILAEFVSANPTGPLVAASGRHAAYGDALSRILEYHGHEVSREYYFNDAGGQIRLLGRVGIAPGAWGGGPRGRLPGFLCDRPGGGDRGRGCIGCGGSGGAGCGADAAEHSGDADSLRRAVRPVLQRAHPARGLALRARAGAGDARRGGSHLPPRGRQVAANDDVRRRQGSRGRAVQRRADVSGGRHRLPAGQARARL